jgi:glycosyltransferase involved in cell wall biosynthesis
LYGAIYYLGYNLVNHMQLRFASRPRQAALAASDGLIAATQENADGAVHYWGCRPPLVISEVGLPAAPLDRTRQQDRSPVRIAWSGNHTAGKALPLGLRALGQLPAHLDWKLDVLGSGEKTTSWKALAAKLRLSSRCMFHGQLTRAEALDVMRNADVLLITSLRDLTSTVTVEALALGLPIVCLDHCGFGSVVDETCGLKVPVHSPGQVYRDLAVALGRIIEDHGLRWRLSEGAKVKSQEFAWDRKIRSMQAIYERKLNLHETNAS